MPTKATPEDLFDFTTWISRPPLAAATVKTRAKGTLTFVIRANDIEDWEAAQDEAMKVPRHRVADRANEILISRCLVAIIPGDKVDLESVEIADLGLTFEDVRTLRKQLGASWTKLVDALNEAGKAQEPDPS